MMARKASGSYKRRTSYSRMSKYIKGNVDERLVLTTLAARTLQGVDFAETVNERTRVSSIRAAYSMDSFTQGTDDGPVMVGIAHSDYTDAEIEQVIEAVQSWNEGDKIAQEVGARLVRTIGIFENPSSATASVWLNDGKPIKTKLNWTLNQGQTLRLWAYNLGQSAFATTAPIVYIQGHANLWPR